MAIEGLNPEKYMSRILSCKNHEILPIAQQNANSAKARKQVSKLIALEWSIKQRKTNS